MALQLMMWFDYRAGILDVQTATERRIYTELTDEATERSLTGSRFLGFTEDTLTRIFKISQIYSVPPQLVASVLAHENGRMGFQAAVWVIHDDIRRAFPDPRDWQIAALCQILQRRAFARILQPEELGPYLNEVAAVYNPGHKAQWAADITILMDKFLAATKLPEKKGRIVRLKSHTRRRV